MATASKSLPISICDEKVLWKGLMRSPHDVIYHLGHYVVADKGNHRVIAFNPYSESPNDLGQGMSGVPKAVASTMEPYGIVATSTTEPNYLVTDLKNKCILERKDRSWSIWSKRTPEGLLPTGIAMDKQGRVYVADFDNHCIHLFNQKGMSVPKRSFGQSHLSRPWFMAFNSRDQLYVADAEKGVQIFDCANGMNGAHRGQLRFRIDDDDDDEWSCRGIAIDKYDNVFISARIKKVMFSTERVAAFSSDHEFIGHTGEYSFNYVRGICIDQDRGHLVVVDGENHSLVRYKLYK